MQRLHKSMIKELKEGVHDPRIQGFFAARGEQISLGDRPSLVQMPAVTDGAAAPAAPPLAAAPVAQVVAEQVPVDDRPVAVSGSIDTASAPRPVAGKTPPPATTGKTPSPTTTAVPPPARKVVVVKPPDIKRPPVVVSSSAEGVVVKRNVVINVGGGAAPVQGQISRGTAMPRPAPRPAVPYVVREGSFPQPTASRGTGSHPAQPSDITPSARDIRMPWDPGGPSDAPPPVRARTPGAPSDHTPTGRAIDHTPTGRVMGPPAVMRTRSPVPPSDRTPAERAFNADLPGDKSLDEVILEYLSDDAE
jgi:hypothetical protein